MILDHMAKTSTSASIHLSLSLQKTPSGTDLVQSFFKELEKDTFFRKSTFHLKAAKFEKYQAEIKKRLIQGVRNADILSLFKEEARSVRILAQKSLDDVRSDVFVGRTTPVGNCALFDWNEAFGEEQNGQSVHCTKRTIHPIQEAESSQRRRRGRRILARQVRHGFSLVVTRRHHHRLTNTDT